MTLATPRTTVLLAEDDGEDWILTKAAFARANPAVQLERFPNGLELLNHVLRLRRDDSMHDAIWPGFILLDLNMPKLDGWEVLSQIKSDPRLRSIPVVIFSTSNSIRDVWRAYQSGANSFLTKPASLQDLIQAVGISAKYWLETVQQPPDERQAFLSE